MFDAKLFRDKKALQILPEEIGYYKWWAEKREFDELLNALNIKFEDVIPYVESKDNLFCIYVGATKDSLRNRINWHINDKHTATSVKSGFLSTMRQSISSLISHNQYDKDSTDDFIDKLKFEVFISNNYEQIEKELLLSNLYILNIQDNKHFYSQDIKKTLKKLRKESK